MSVITDEVIVDAAGIQLEGNLSVPQNANGIVIFAHGSGSSRFSSRNRYVAQVLRDGGVGTLLIDLLTAQEEAIDVRTRHLRFDIELLADRLTGAQSVQEFGHRFIRPRNDLRRLHHRCVDLARRLRDQRP